MKTLTELRNNLLIAEQTYKTAKTSLDGSLEYILAKEELKIARYNYALACRDYVEELYAKGVFENV